MPLLLQRAPRRLVSMTAPASWTKLDLISVPAWQAIQGGTVKTVSTPPAGSGGLAGLAWGGLSGWRGCCFLVSRILHPTRCMVQIQLSDLGGAGCWNYQPLPIAISHPHLLQIPLKKDGTILSQNSRILRKSVAKSTIRISPVVQSLNSCPS